MDVKPTSFEVGFFAPSLFERKAKAQYFNFLKYIDKERKEWYNKYATLKIGFLYPMQKKRLTKLNNHNYTLYKIR